jgi:hypothetical protein
LLIVASLLWTAAARAQGATANVTLAIDTTRAQAAAIPSDFSGLSFEMGSVLHDRASNGWFLSGNNSAMIALAKTLGIKSVRVGGNSAETGNIATAADEDAVLDFCHAIGANLIWDLEIKGPLYDPAGKAAVAQSMQNYLNSKGYGTNTNSLVFQVGNEPDLVRDSNGTGHIKVSTYDSEFSSYLSAINGLFPGARMAGPDTAGGGTPWCAAFCAAEGSSGQIAFVCQHLYFFGRGPASSPVAPRIASMLSAGNEDGYGKFLNRWVPPAMKAGLATRYEETNSFFHGGAPGVSDAYASALWGLGYLYYHAQAGLDGLNFHTATNSPYTAISPTGLTDTYTVNPLGYGIAAFNVGGHGHMVPVSVGNSGNVNLVAYSVLQSDGSLILTVINREYGPSARDASLAISTSDASYNDAQVMFLTGSNNDPSTLTGVTLGGSAISGQGVWKGAYMGLAPPSPDSFALTLPGAQAAIIRLFSANGPAAPTNFTTSPGNSQETLKWTASTGATSYVIQRSAIPGGPYATIATGVTGNSYVDSGLPNGSKYYYVAAASNANGIGPQSTEASSVLMQPVAAVLNTPSSHPAVDLQTAQKRALALYPDLAVANSPLNKEFIARYQRYKAENPTYFLNPDWPTALARESADAINQR